MTRFVIQVGNEFVTAVYSKNEWIAFTRNPDDAGSWVTYERVVEAAKIVARYHGGDVKIRSIEEPSYPRSWRIQHV